MKKFLSLFLCLILLLGLLPLAAPARAYSSGDWEYYYCTESGGNYVMISKYTGAGGKVTIPSTLAGKPVKEIGSNVFRNRTDLTSVTIPSSVTSIDGSAFYGCSSLTSVAIPSGVTAIESSAFRDCTGLTSVTIPSGVSEIGYYAFYGCTGLTSVTISKGTTTIGDGAFHGCTGLTSMTIPNSVISIGHGAFEDCSSLTSVTIPNSVTSIGNGAFEDCTGLTSVTIPNSVTSIGSCAFYNCTSLTSLTIGNGVTEISWNAFCNCTGLTKVNISDIAAWCAIEFGNSWANPLEYAHVLYLNGKAVTKLTIPDGVERIGSYAFSGCSALRSVAFPASVTSVGQNAFNDCSALTRVDISDLAAWCSIEFGDNPLSYAKHLYLNGAEVTDLTVPAGVRRIGNRAFAGCDGLTSVTIPRGVTAIGNGAFWSCQNLTAATIPTGVTTIGSIAFSGCSSLTSLTIPKSVTGIGDDAFNCCYGLSSLVVSGDHVSLGKSPFSYCSGLASAGPVGSGCDLQVNIPDIIPDNTFENLSGLRTVVIPGTVTEIRQDAFSGCSNLQHVYYGGTEARWEEILILGGNDKLLSAELHCSYQTGDTIIVASGSCGDNLTYTLDQKGKLTVSGSGAINSNAFHDSSCRTLIRRAVLETGVTSIGDYAFYGCTGLTSVTIPGSVTSIGGPAFSGCTGLTSAGPVGSGCSIEFGWTDKIPSDAFSSSNLTSVTIPSSVTSIGGSAFSGCTGLTSVTIPSSVASIGHWAFYGCTGLTDVYYGGTEEEWGGIYIDSDNGPLTSAAIHYAGPLVLDRVKANKTTATTGEKITWTATASGGFGALQYYFAVYKDGTPVAKRGYSTTRTYSYTPTEPGTYKVRVYVKDANETKLNKLSAAVTVTQGPPVVTTQPANQTVAAGATATFKVVASGNGLSYQWQYSKDGGTTWYNKTDATSTSCTVTAKTAYDGFRYRCRVKNEVGTVYSNPAELTVLPKPVITTQPANQTVAAGATATFKAVASGTGLTYQWQYSKDGGTTWYNKTGATETSCTVTAKTSYDGFLYRCKVKNSAGTVYSSSAKLTVTSSAAPVISSVKADKTAAAAGTKITWTATATGGTGTLQYYFILYKDGTKVKTRSYSTTNTFSYTPTEAGTYKVRVYVKDAADTKVSKLGTAITVTAGSAAPVISSIKANKTSAATGETITWTATAAGGTGTLQYYFIVYKDGTKVKTRAYSTANTFSYTPTEAGTYKAKVYVKDAADTKVSKLGTAITVTAGAELTISSIKANKTSANVGETITWTATAAGGTGTLQYYFIVYKDGTKVKTRAYSTANTFSYTPTEAGTYKAKVYVKDAADTKVSKLSGSVTVSVLNPTQDDPGIELTDGNPSGDAKTISFTTRNELTGGKTGTARAFTAQPLDNGYTRFSLSYSIPEQMYISVFNPPEGTLFMLESQTENAGQSGNLIFDLKNKDLNAIEEVSIKFYKSDEEVFWVFFYTDQLK